MGRLLLQLLDFTNVFGMHLRPELVLLQKTMVQVEGVARNLDPEHNIWDAAKPVVEDWIRTEFGPSGLSRQAGATLRNVAQRAIRLPQLLDQFETIMDAQSKAALSQHKSQLPAYLNKPFQTLFFISLSICTGVLSGLWIYNYFFA
jgi:ubiquinone biosynthesis protein